MHCWQRRCLCRHQVDCAAGPTTACSELIAVTGMRLSEAIGLKCDDVDLDAGVLTVRLTKFGKSRLVPLHPTTSAALRDYAHRRDAQLASHAARHFFVAEHGGPLAASVRSSRLLAIVP